MANISSANPDTITATDASNNQLVFNDNALPSNQIGPSGSFLALITVTEGSFQFGVGQNPVATAPVIAAGEKESLTFQHNSKNIFFKAAASGNKFTIRVV